MTAGNTLPSHGLLVEGAHRAVDPAGTVARMEPFFARCGITRVANVTGLDSIGIPVVMVMRPNSRSVAVSQGKGISLDAARASGIMEAVETWHAERIDATLRYARYRDLTDGNLPVADPGTLPRPQGSPFDENLPIMWIEAQDLITRQACWVPYEMVHTDYTWPPPPGHGCFACSSNGLASGNTWQEAIVHAICEVVERDATSLWYQAGPRSKAARRLDLHSVSDPDCRRLVETIAGAGLDIAVWDTTTEIGVPSFYGLLSGGEHDHVGEGAGCHPARAVALARTLTEAVQTRMTYISGARDDMMAEEFSAAGMAEKQHLVACLTSDAPAQRPFDQIEDLATASIDDDLACLFAGLRNADAGQVLCADLSRPEFPVSVVRVIIPGLEAPHDDAGYVPGPRARRCLADMP